MPDITKSEWDTIQTGINTCAVCLSEPLFDTKSIPPARPWNPEHSSRLLLISENPPPTGGFWEINEDDSLRENVLRLLQIPHENNDHRADLEAFLSYRTTIGHEFFLVQTLKWPYVESLWNRKRGYNQLSHRQKCMLIGHSVSAHLGVEIALIAPAAILAMGNAAWNACRALSKNYHKLPDKGVEQVRGKPYELQLEFGLIPLNVTHLPVGQNLNRPKRAKEVQQDFADFLNRNNLTT